MRQGLRLLRENRTLLNLWLASTVSLLGSWFNTVAVLTLITGFPNAGMALTWYFLCRSLPGVVLSPFSGAIVDRLPRKAILVATDLVRVGFSLLYILVRGPEQLWIVYLAAACMSTADNLFYSAWDSSIPGLVDKQDLTTTNVLFSAASSFTVMLGALLGGTVARLVTPNVAFVVNALSFVFSLVVISLTTMPRLAGGAQQGSYWAEVAEGFAAIRKTPIALGCVLTGISWGLAGGGYSILLSYMGAVVYQWGGLGIGLLYTVDGFGLLMGHWLVGQLNGRGLRRSMMWYGAGYALQGIFFALFAACRSPLLGTAFLLAMRVASGLIIPLDTSLLQRSAPPQVLGRIFALHSATYTGVMQLSLLWTGFMLSSIGPHATGAALGLIASVGGFGWLWALRIGKLVPGDHAWPA